MRTLGAEPCGVAPAFAHLGHRTAPSPAGGPLGRNGGGLGHGGRRSYSVVNEQTGPRRPSASRTLLPTFTSQPASTSMQQPSMAGARLQ